MSFRASMSVCHLLEITKACPADPDVCTVVVTKQVEILKLPPEMSKFP